MDDLNHLVSSIKSHFTTSVDYKGNDYLGLNLDWNYKKDYVEISMQGYVYTALKKFLHKSPRSPQHAPHDWNVPAYGQKIQFTEIEDKSPLLTEKDTKLIQAISGTFIYYGRAVDPTILPALNEISMQQSAPTQNTKKKCNRLLDYLYTNPNAIIRCKASAMILQVDTDSVYLVLPKARSRSAGHYYLTNDNLKNPPHNGPIYNLYKTMRNVLSSAAEAETSGSFLNA